jgi:hypothetical protein
MRTSPEVAELSGHAEPCDEVQRKAHQVCPLPHRLPRVKKNTNSLNFITISKEEKFSISNVVE